MSQRHSPCGVLMATCLFSEVERDMDKQGWVMERPFLSLYIGEGHFIVQMRPKGEPMEEMYSTVVEMLGEVFPVHRNC